MDVARKNSTPAPVGNSHISVPGKCEAGKAAENSQSPVSGSMQVVRKDVMPSLVPPHSLPEKVPESTPPNFLPQKPIATVNRETVDLANHVSLEVFSLPESRDNKNVMVFLHGGPGLAYDENYEPVTNWFLGHGYTVVAPEIAGSGEAGLKNKSNSHTQNYVTDLKSVVQHLRARPDMQGKEFCVVAHSWGGFQLGSLLTDDTAEERTFFKQAVFISPNLDSAQTRLFADASQFNDISDVMLTAFESTLVRNFEERHSGSKEEMDNSEKMTVLNNPLIDQSLNEKFSPFYRLDKIPRNIPCLFFHATDDKQVPVSQSVDAFARINHAGGNARIVISGQGGHAFFKTGNDYRDEVMTNCFDAIDAFVKQGESSEKVMINGVAPENSGIVGIEDKIRESDQHYENYTKVLDDFHEGIEAPAGNERKKIPPRKKLLGKIAAAHVNIATMQRSSPSESAKKHAASNERIAQEINDALEKS